LAEVPVSELRPACDPSTFTFETTAEVEPHIGLIGQDRAVDAIKFGLSFESRGYNVVVAGEPGTGRATAIREYLQEYARGKPPPDEWCYVNNFADPHQPRAIRLPPGKGRAFQDAMRAVINEARERIPRTFESEDYVNRRDEILSSVQRHHEQVFSRLAETARENGFLLQGNPAGFFLVPLIHGQPMDDQSFAALSPQAREETLRRRDELMDGLREVMKGEQGFDAAASERLSELQRTIATTVVSSLTDRLFEAYREYPAVLQWLVEIRREMIEHVDDFMRRPEAAPSPIPMLTREVVSPFRKYEVNLLVDCSEETCATVVFESNPTPQRLFGRIEKEAVFGAVTTDFTMIRPGSLHRANGGYFVFDFEDILQYPLSWNELKRTIRTGQLTIEEMGERLGYIETKTVRPEPVPWTGKIVGIAREQIYRLLYLLDPDFRELFKVKADFDMNIDRTAANERAYAGLIAGVTKREKLPPLDRGAVARVVEEGMRLAEDHNKLSIKFGDLTDIVRESCFWAQQRQADVVTQEHVSQAISERIHRVNLIEKKLREQVTKGVIVVDTEGEAIGQVNGLSVVELGDTAFGQPSRITATIGVGREGVVDLQR
jgi:predicted ATP-dependent protease